MNSETKVKQRPILFSTQMAQAILEGRKTVTRRTLKIQPEPPRAIYEANEALPVLQENGDDLLLRFNWKAERHGQVVTDTSFFDGRFKCPYGKVGHLIWVREEHYRFGHWEPVPGVRTKQGRQKWAFVPDTEEVLYFDNPPAEFRKGRHHKDPATPAWHKRLARFMPRNLCRIYLEITDIKVERLQDITEEQALAEGIINRGAFGFTAFGIDQSETARDAFKYLWGTINGPDSWKNNPFVFPISFKRINKPE